MVLYFFLFNIKAARNFSERRSITILNSNVYSKANYERLSVIQWFIISTPFKHSFLSSMSDLEDRSQSRSFNPVSFLILFQPGNSLYFWRDIKLVNTTSITLRDNVDEASCSTTWSFQPRLRV